MFTMAGGYKYKETESIDFVESFFVDPPVYIYGL